MSIFSAPSFYNQADQNIYGQGFSFIPQERFRGGAFSFPTSATTTGSPSGIQTLPMNMNRSGGGSGGSGNIAVDELLKNFSLDTRNQYFNNQATPLVDDLRQSKLDQTFLGFPSFREQQLTGADLGEYIGSGTDVPLELTTAGKIQSTLGNIKDKAGGIMSTIGGLGPISFLTNKMDRFGSLPLADQEFIKRNMGYKGPTVFGDNTSGLNKDPFGVNVRSAFGNYAEFVGEQKDKLGDLLANTMTERYGVEFDPITGQFVGKNAARANYMNKMNLAKYNFYAAQTKQRDLDRQIALDNALKEAQREIKKQGYIDYGSGGGRDESLNTGPGGSYSGRGDEGATGANFSGDFATDSASYDLAEGGRVGYMGGGLTDLVDIYD